VIKNGRGARADWLSDAATIESLAGTMVAMANTQGGVIMIGLGASGSVVGVRDTDSAVDKLIQAALPAEPPLIIPMPRVNRMSEKPVVVADIPRGLPHVYSLDGRYLYREGAENTALKPRDIRRLLIERGEASFETEIVRSASMDDLDWDSVKAYVAALGSI